MFSKKNLLLLIPICFFFQSLCAQTLYSRAYGKRINPAIIYVHGGPRGNSTLFEGTTAQRLADLGFYVIAYDRRGEGRSSDPSAWVTYAEAINDLNGLMAQYKLKKVSLIGHSFGGLVSTLFTQQYPQKVERLILVAALFAQQESYDHILNSATVEAVQKEDTLVLKKIALIKTLDTASAKYRQLVYELGSSFGYFKMPNPTKESISVNRWYETGVFFKQNIRNDHAPILFYQNEPRRNIDTKNILSALPGRGVKLFGIYGQNDGIFSKKQLLDLRQIIGSNNLFLIDNCSHYPFVDQQSVFLKDVKSIMLK